VKTRIRHGFRHGWVRDRPDPRDYGFERLVKLRSLRTAGLPGHAFLRRFCSEVTDQGQLGSCTANALANLLEYNECAAGRGGQAYEWLSRLFIHYNERVIEGSVSQDAGAELRDGIKVLAAQGVCPEPEWPYVVSQFAVKPPAKCYSDALTNLIHSYYRLATVDDMRTSLANGYPFVFGFTVFTAFQSDQVASTGVLNVPQPGEQPLGGHAVMCMGYNDAQQRFLVKNSWGKQWGLPGMPGYFTVPYNYLADVNLASDFWAVHPS
jgi:C1A family cysteine protease